MEQILVPKVAAIFVLDNEGNRLSAKYFTRTFTNNAEKVRPSWLHWPCHAMWRGAYPLVVPL